jgi:hypothetical protein
LSRARICSCTFGLCEGGSLSAAIAQRLLVLAAAALACGLVVLAVQATREHRAEPGEALGAVAPGGWYTAFAASRGAAGDAERTTCGLVLTTRSLGVTHPVLPCGVKLLLRFRNETVFTEVIDNRLKSARTQFELTEGLAREIGLDGTQRLDWRFATAPAR